MGPSREELIKQDNVTSWEFKFPSNTSTKKKWSITSTCTKCGEETAKWYNRKWTDLCGKCSRGRRTTSEFIQAAIESHGEEYAYSNTNYINNDTKVSITCSTHGDWKVRPTDFLSGSTCPKCAKIAVSKSLEHTKEEWEELLLNPRVTITSKDSKEFGTFDCNLHGTFKARFVNASTSQHSGCIICSRLHHIKQSIIPTLTGMATKLYWVYLPDIDMYKLGVTTGSIAQRFSGKGNVSPLWVKILPYELALGIEHKIHNNSILDRYKGSKKLLKEGTYELYHNNIFPTYEDAYDRI